MLCKQGLPHLHASPPASPPCVRLTAPGRVVIHGWVGELHRDVGDGSYWNREISFLPSTVGFN